MNIFFLDRDPKKAAAYHCDKHIVKMAIEYAQILSTVIHITHSIKNEWVYKQTHILHPCTIWASQSLSHWRWLWLLGHHVGNEYTRRYGKIHMSTRVLRCLLIPNKLPDLGWLKDPPQVMPDEYKDKNTVIAYRNYYLGDKSKFTEWNHSTMPEWFNLKSEVK